MLPTFPYLQWKDINLHLSFCNLTRYVSTMRYKWIWGRTSWMGTAPYWRRDEHMHKRREQAGALPNALLLLLLLLLLCTVLDSVLLVVNRD